MDVFKLFNIMGNVFPVWYKCFKHNNHKLVCWIQLGLFSHLSNKFQNWLNDWVNNGIFYRFCLRIKRAGALKLKNLYFATFHKSFIMKHIEKQLLFLLILGKLYDEKPSHCKIWFRPKKMKDIICWYKKKR